MRKKIYLLVLLSAFLMAGRLTAQESLAEKLGYAKDAKLLIIHADDAGMCNAENMATEEALSSGSVTCTSVMVPCPWSDAFLIWAASHPDADVGIHLTLTAEWDQYRWDGVLPADQIPTLLDPKGYFYNSEVIAADKADPLQVEAELRAQIDHVIAMGVHPSHLDSHMGTMFRTPELFKIFLKLGKEYGLPVLIPKNMIGMYPQLTALIGDEPWFVDNLYMLVEGVSPEKWTETYGSIIKSMKPGLNELIVHLGKDNDELRAITKNHPDYGAAWRQRDFDFVTSETCKSLLKENNIHLVTWQQIKKVTFPAK